MERGNDADEGEKEIEGGDDIFKGVKQVDSHVLKVGFGGIVFIGTCRKK